MMPAPEFNASNINVSCLSSAAHGAGVAELHHDFNLVVLLILSFASIWCAGKAASKLGLPTLVGEILVGVVLGPQLQYVDSTVLRRPTPPNCLFRVSRLALLTLGGKML